MCVHLCDFTVAYVTRDMLHAADRDKIHSRLPRVCISIMNLLPESLGGFSCNRTCEGEACDTVPKICLRNMLDFTAVSPTGWQFHLRRVRISTHFCILMAHRVGLTGPQKLNRAL